MDPERLTLRDAACRGRQIRQSARCSAAGAIATSQLVAEGETLVERSPRREGTTSVVTDRRGKEITVVVTHPREGEVVTIYVTNVGRSTEGSATENVPKKGKKAR